MFKHDKDAAAGRVQLGNANQTMIGIVTDNANPEGDYRVKVKFPTLPGEDSSHWCRIATFGAGPGGQGAFFLPEVDDEVLVVFVSGDINQAVVVGTLWNGRDRPSYSNQDGSSKTDRFQGNDARFKGQTEAKKNDVRALSSRARHELLFNDNASNPRVTLSSGKKHRIVLDDSGNEPTQIEIVDGKDENLITIDTKNKKITIESKTGDLLLKAKKSITLEAEEKIVTRSKQDTEMTSQANFKAEAQSNVSIKASGSGELQSAGTLTVKGATVNIN